jgi:hypothetical protein
MKKLIYLIVLTLILGLVLTGSSHSLGLLDSVNIGDTTNEAGHNLLGWSDPWIKPGWGGNYGGGSDDETLRLLMGPGDGCAGFEDAYFTMNTNGAEAHELILHHLDGTAPDDFDVHIFDGTVYEFIGSYTQQTTTETWVTTEYSFSSPRIGELKFKLVATVPIGSWCAVWGQVGFSWAELHGLYLVTIDIKPGSDPNSINLTEQGVLPVAIFGSSTFDVDSIDLSTIEIGGAGVASRGSAKASKMAVSFEDVDLDGIMDLVAFFRVQDLVAEGALEGTTNKLMLEAETTGGVPIYGTDDVNVVP